MVNNTLSKNNRQDFFLKKAWIYLESAFQWRRLEQLPLEVVVPVAVNRERRRDLEFQWWWETWKKNWGLGSWLDAREEETEGLQTLPTFCLRFFFFFFPGLTVDLSGYGQLGSHVLIFCSVQYQTELRFGLWFGRLSGKLKGLDWAGLGWAWQML